LQNCKKYSQHAISVVSYETFYIVSTVNTQCGFMMRHAFNYRPWSQLCCQ